VKACLPDVFLTTVSYPIRGTPYYDEVAGRIETGNAWELGTDRDLDIRGRRSRDYYRFADQLLQSEVALQKSGAADPLLAAELAAKISDARTALRGSDAEATA
jgi:hypothetical protein